MVVRATTRMSMTGLTRDFGQKAAQNIGKLHGIDYVLEYTTQMWEYNALSDPETIRIAS